MMEILTRGVRPTEVPITAQCRSCNSVLRFTTNEGKIRRDQRDGDYVEVTCPVCGASVTKALK